jgi:hypothetical protein
MLRQTPLETTRESRPGEQVNHFLAFAELMLRRGVGELAGEGEAPEPPVTTNDTNLSEIILNMLSYVCQFDRFTQRSKQGFPPMLVALSHQPSAIKLLPARARRA